MNLTESILSTLRYSDHFSFPLTFAELHSRLIKLSTNQKRLTSHLKLCLKDGRLAQTTGYYHLPGRSSLVKSRLKRARASKPLIARARMSASNLGRLPGVVAVYLTGSLAMRNIDRDSDIDLMIITSSGRLWTTRLLLTVYTSLLRLRRTPSSTRNFGKLCLNLYLTSASLTIPPSRRSLYSAYELIQAVPLYDPVGTHSKLLSANSWINKFLPNYEIPISKFSSPRAARRYSILEKIAYHLQLLYMRRRLTREYVALDAAFFHPHDPGEGLLRNLSL